MKYRLGLSLTFARSRTANIFDLVRIYFAIVRRFCESWFWWRSVNVTLAASMHGYLVSSFDERKHQEWVPLYYRLVHFRLPSKWLKYWLFYMAVEPVLNCVRYFTSRTFLSSMFVCNLKYHWLTRRTCADVIRAFKLSPEKRIWRRCDCSFVSIIRNSRRHTLPEIVRNVSLWNF